MDEQRSAHYQLVEVSLSLHWGEVSLPAHCLNVGIRLIVNWFAKEKKNCAFLKMGTFAKNEFGK